MDISLFSCQLLLLFVQVIQKESLENLLDTVVHSEELPAHAEEEELGVPVGNQYLVDCIPELFVLPSGSYSDPFIDYRLLGLSFGLLPHLMALLNYLIYDIQLLLWHEGALVELLILIVAPHRELILDVLKHVIIDVRHQQLSCRIIMSDLKPLTIQGEG